MKKTTLACIITTILASSSYSFAASLSLEAKESTVTINCPTSVDILIDTQGAATNTVDTKIIQKDNFQLRNISSENGVFDQYVKSTNAKIRNGIHKGEKSIYIMGSKNGGEFNGKGLFASINILPTQTGKIDLELYMIPGFNGDDSNITVLSGGKAYDHLDIATGTSIQVIEGECEIDDNYYSEENTIGDKSNIIEKLQEENKSGAINLLKNGDLHQDLETYTAQEDTLRNKIRRFFRQVIQKIAE